MPKRVTSYSPKSKFAPDGYRRISANLKFGVFCKLKMLTVATRKPAGVILEELIADYGDQIKPLDNVISIEDETMRTLDNFVDVSNARKKVVPKTSDPNTMALNRNLKSASLNVTLGADVLSAAGLREGDNVSLLLNGREAAIVRGGTRKLKRCYSQFKVDFAKVLLVDQSTRFQPTIEGGVIYFDVPESVEINQELVP